MPTVRDYGGRQVDTKPLPAVRKRAGETALSAGVYLAEAQAGTGEAMAQLGGQVAHISNQVLQAQAEERERADQVAVMKADTALGQWELKRVYDPNSGALTVKGEAAMTLPEQMAAEQNEVADALEADLHTPKQREAFARLRAQRGLSLSAQMRRHTFGEIQRVEGEVLQATVETASATAMANATDPDRVHLEMAKGVQALRISAPRLGKTPEEVDREVDKFTTATHVGVINNLLATGKHQQAKAWLEDAKKEGGITGEALGQAEKAVKAGVTQQTSLEAADKIIAGGGTAEEQLAKAAKLGEDIDRELVERRIEHAETRAKVAERQSEQEVADKAYAWIDGGNSLDKLPPPVLDRLKKNGSVLPALRSFEKSKAENIPIKTDQTYYYELKETARLDPKAYLAENLLKYRDKLSDADFQELTNLKAIVQRGNEREVKEALGGFSTNKELWDSTLKDWGFDPNTKDTVDIDTNNQIRRQFDLYVEDQQRGGKKLPDEDAKRYLDQVLGQRTAVPGAMYGTRETALVNVTADQIPAADRARIEARLRAEGTPVSPVTVREAYIGQMLALRGVGARKKK